MSRVLTHSSQYHCNARLSSASIKTRYLGQGFALTLVKSASFKTLSYLRAFETLPRARVRLLVFRSDLWVTFVDWTSVLGRFDG